MLIAHVHTHSFKELGEGVKNWAEAFALVCGGVFFLYKALSGYLVTNISLSVQTERRCSSKNGYDELIITAKLSKGDRGSVLLHDAQARVSYDEKPSKPIPFADIERRSRGKDAGPPSRYKIKWDERSGEAPFLRLTPGETMEMACLDKIPSQKTCKVEVVILGKRSASWKTGQWRASCISHPESIIASTAGPSKAVGPLRRPKTWVSRYLTWLR